MKYIIGPMLAVIFAQLHFDGYHLAAAATAFVAGLWCGWQQREEAA